MTRSSVAPSPLFLILLAVTVGGGVLSTVDQNVARTAGIVLLVLGGWAVSLCLHEFGHAYLALRGGDYSVRHKGYLTLDIRRYTDPVLSILMPLLLLAVGGIPLPGGAVWIDRHALRTKRAESLVSLAGPIANLVIGLLLIATVALTNPPVGLAAGLSYLAYLQMLAFVLNILPIPGLDGFGVIEPYLSYQAREFGAKARPWAPFVLFALLIGVPVVGQLFSTVVLWVFETFGGNVRDVFFGQRWFRFWEGGF
ncbi:MULTISPECIES: site-2 protease family protein [unclassified Crossiella]|uniref:site-2 protease family protein n=1 Tax=unclassified Crossiella TaxID=2620835 RepID=UPI001FFEBF9F|nr:MULTISPECIES: site-2 protease family protein [unclassified Crossiella]MCK2243874.1 site-2 protease family protein [Crossiella sp. S99.2]MCK2257268.1 site-2 protease family protein [Crossiella sp. S99.1]